MSGHVCGDSGGWAETWDRPCQRPVSEKGSRCPHHPTDGEPVQNGRPTVYEAEIADRICERMAAGETLREVCRDEAMPPESTVRRWALDDRDGFAARYARARRLQADHWADEIVSISDARQPSEVPDPESGESVQVYDTQRDRLRVDTRKWLLSKLRPEKYGRRQRVEHSGPGGGPIRTEQRVQVEQALEQLSEDDLETLAQLRARAGIGSTNGAGP